MSDTPFIKFYPSDFLAGTSGLSPAERGVYITLLCLIYENNGAIEGDLGRLARRCGAPKAAFTRILAALVSEGKITEADGMLSNRRAEKALVDRQNRTQIGTHAANTRWSAQGQKGKQKQRREHAAAMPEQCAGDASQKPEPDIKTEAKASAKKQRRKPSVPLPEGWVPDGTLALRLMDRHDLTERELNLCLQQMRDDANAKDKRNVEWGSAFSKWVGNAVQWGHVGPGSRSRQYRSGGPGAGTVAAFAEVARERHDRQTQDCGELPF